MTQMLTRIAITFQSTSWKASTSVITPNQIITITPSSAATVPSTTLEMTATIAMANTIRANQARAVIADPRRPVGQFGSLHEHDRQLGAFQDLQRRAADQQLGERTAPVRSHHDVVAAEPGGKPRDAVGRRADLLVRLEGNAGRRQPLRRRLQCRGALLVLEIRDVVVRH